MQKTNSILEYLSITICTFLLLGLFFIPFPFHVFSFQQDISQFLFGDLIVLILKKGWGMTFANLDITSDSITMYVLIGVLFMLAVLAGIALLFLKKGETIKNGILRFSSIVFTYYLALQLLAYGFNKLFKAQFYLPEPNILYTPLGQISKDLLFWSSMGTSYSYNIFMGLLEIIPALLLMFEKTRILGLMIAIPVLMNIVAINFGFDISVKIYSLFLLGLALFLMFPHLKKCYEFLVLRKEVSLQKPLVFLRHQPFLRTTLKAFAIGLIFLEALFPYFMSLNFNDDNARRPFLHGAYEIQNTHLDEDIQNLDIKRIFIHRKGYLIFQNEKDEMQDFKLVIDTIQNRFILTNYQEQERKLDFEYLPKDSLLRFQYFQNGKAFWLESKALDWQQLPALQHQFHWTVEAVD